MHLDLLVDVLVLLLGGVCLLLLLLLSSVQQTSHVDVAELAHASKILEKVAFAHEVDGLGQAQQLLQGFQRVDAGGIDDGLRTVDVVNEYLHAPSIWL
mgnify:CR=1 FL=1